MFARGYPSDGCYIAVADAVGYDVGVGGGLLLVAACRYQTTQTTQFNSFGERLEVAEKQRLAACDDSCGEQPREYRNRNLLVEDYAYTLRFRECNRRVSCHRSFGDILVVALWRDFA